MASLKKIHFACPRWLCSFSICWTIVTALHKHQYIKVLSATTLLRNNWRPLSWRWKFVIFYPFPCFSFLTFLYICSNYKTSRALWTVVLFSSVLEKETFIQSGNCQMYMIFTSEGWVGGGMGGWGAWDFLREALKKIGIFLEYFRNKTGEGWSVFLSFMWNFGGHCLLPWKPGFFGQDSHFHSELTFSPSQTKNSPPYKLGLKISI